VAIAEKVQGERDLAGYRSALDSSFSLVDLELQFSSGLSLLFRSSLETVLGSLSKRIALFTV